MKPKVAYPMNDYLISPRNNTSIKENQKIFLSTGIYPFPNAQVWHKLSCSDLIVEFNLPTTKLAMGRSYVVSLSTIEAIY